MYDPYDSYDENTDPRIAAQCERAARFCALAVAALGGVVLIAWALDIALLKSVLPGWMTMKANTAFGFLLLGAALLGAGCSKDGGWCKARTPLAATVALLGLATLAEYLFDVNLGIDQLLFVAPLEPASLTPSGRMAAATAAAFVLSGLALLMLDWRRWRGGAQVVALAASLIGILAVLGYAYDVAALYGVGTYSSVALHTAIGFVVLNVGVLLVRPQRGVIAVVTSATLGGVMARRLLPLAIMTPFAIGWLRVQGENLGIISSPFGTALVQLAYVTLFSIFIWRTADVLRRSEQRRSVAERGLQRQDATLAGIIDSAMDAIVMVDAGQRIVLFNPAAEQMFGHQAADVLGGPLDVLLPQRFRAAHGAHLRAFAGSGVTSRRMGSLGAIAGRRADGDEFPIEASISQLIVEGEQYFTVILRDITERQRGENRLRAATAEAERANNAKSRVLAAASHDLRQPLAALGLYVNVLRDQVAPAGQPLLGSMDDCISSLSGLLTDLLDLSKLDAGVVKPEIASFSVAEFLATLESVYTPAATMKGLRLRFVTSRLTGRCDRGLLKRIVGNFIANAIRYTDRGGVLVACRRRQGKAWIEVWDSGIGIAADKTAEIFEEFKQLGDSARNRGSGLGLAIAARTAALLGLQISVRSWPGRGSVFAIELPLGPPAEALVAAPRAALSRSLRIALVEDNPLVREALVVTLRAFGHQVIAAASGDALLAEAGNLPPDIVVTDYRLAYGETGYDVITAMRQAARADLPAIVITGDTDPTLIASMADRGIAVLHKPFAMEELQAWLEDLTWQGSASAPHEPVLDSAD